MFKFLRKHFTNKEVVHFSPNLSSAGLELSDGDRAALYGWPDKTVEDVMKHEQQRG